MLIAWTELGIAERSPSREGAGTLLGFPKLIAWTELGIAERSPSREGAGTLLGFPMLIVEAVHAELLPEVLAGDAQDLGGHRPLTVCLGQRPLQVFALELLERRPEWPRR